MNKLIAFFLLFTIPVITHAQFERLANRVKNKITERVDRKVDKEIEKALNKAEEQSTEKKPTATLTKSSETTSSNSTISSPEKAEKKDESIKSFSKYDFIPGEKILYAEDFSQDAIGELPLGWNTNGKAEVVTFDAFAGKWMKLYQNATYLTSNKTAFTKNFTLEFDIIMQLKNGGYTFPLFTFGFLSSHDKPTTDNDLLNVHNKYQSADVLVRPSINGASYVNLSTNLDNKKYFRGNNQKMGSLEDSYNKECHVAMQAQETRLRIWINSEKIYDIPQALAANYIFNQMFFNVSSSGYKDDQIGFYISNLKAATGVPDIRHKLLEEGKFSTTAILFDVNMATLKPTSYGVIKDIAKVLKENVDCKINIIGHTDSDGSDASNMTLSQKRAAAVKEALVTDFSIEASRITTEGKGESVPVMENNSKEGKAANRRVEFVKL
jgi:OmpA-OmpF porin, OOP family